MDFGISIVKSILTFMCAALVTTCAIPIFIKIAQRFLIVDAPDGVLKKQAASTPYFGGLAVYLGFISGLAFFFPVENNLSFVLVGTTLLLFVGFIDDLIVLSPWQKWCGQLFAAICFLRGGLYFKELFFSAHVSSLAPGLLGISFLWIVSITNAFNLIDVMDGLATTVALCIGGSLLVFACIAGLESVCVLLAALMGALAAFLVWNKPVARMYLGDTGSLFIGGVLSVVPFMIPWSEHTLFGFLTAPALFFIPCMELVSLIVIRTIRGIPFYQGSPDHFSHYLRRRGWEIKKILLLVILFSLILLLSAVTFFFNHISLSAAIGLGMGGLISWIFLVFNPFEKLFRGGRMQLKWGKWISLLYVNFKGLCNRVFRLAFK